MSDMYSSMHDVFVYLFSFHSIQPNSCCEGFLGSIVGMLTLGYLGDKIGRQAATTITLSLMAFGALGSSVCVR